MATPNATIRPGTSDDCPAILELLTALSLHSGQGAVMDDVAELRRDGFEDHPWYHTFVAEIQHEDGMKEVVGVAMYYFGYTTFNGRSVNLQSLYVKEVVRKQGLGKQLYEEVVKAGVAKGCKLLFVNTVGSNSIALNLYKSHGAVDLTETHDVHLLAVFEQCFTLSYERHLSDSNW